MRLTEVLSPTGAVSLAVDRFSRYKTDLMMRVGNVQGNLESMGLKSAVLDTQGLVELYYRVYNPDVFETEKMAETGKIRTADNQGTI